MTYDFDRYEPFEKATQGQGQGQKKTGSGYWLKATSESGRLVVFGSFQFEQEATDYGFRHFGSDFEVVWLPTRDQARATRMIKKRVFDEIENLDKALERASHKAETP